MAKQQDVMQVENRSERFSIRLRPGERWALKLVAAYEDKTESDLLRQYTLPQIEERAAGIGPRRGNAA